MVKIIRGVVTRAMEPNLAPDTDPLALEGSKLTVKLKFNVSLCRSPVSVNIPCQSLDSGSYKATWKMMAKGTVAARVCSIPVVDQS